MPKSKTRKTKKPNKVLMLFDHDGTLCETNAMAYESLKQAYISAVDYLKIDVSKNVDWDKAFSDTRGSTEKNLVRYLCYAYGIPYNKSTQFEDKFYYFRASWYKNMHSCKEYIWDTYYPDAHELLYECSKAKNYINWIVTGNPSLVIKQRLSNSIRAILTTKKNEIAGIFGEEAYTRADLIKLAVEKAAKAIPDFKPEKDKLGFMTNVFYVGDSRSDFFAGVEAKVNTIWIPSRSLQTIIDTKNEDYVKFITSTLGNRLLITNDLFSEEAIKFVRLKSRSAL